MNNTVDELHDMVAGFADGLIDNIVDDNTLVFTEADAEAARKAKEERAREAENKTMAAKKDAQDLVRSAKELYSKTGDSVEYIKFKASADANSLGKILYQVEVSEDAIRAVTDAIQGGDTNPNMFKCLTDLQRTMMELLKTKNLYLSSIEDSFKQLTNDIEMSSAVEIEGYDEQDTAVAKVNSSRDLMQLIDKAANKIKEENQSKQTTDE